MWKAGAPSTKSIKNKRNNLVSDLVNKSDFFIFPCVSHTLAETAKRYTKVLWWALLFVIGSGVAMLFGDTVRNLLNSIFWIKMGLVVVGILLAIAYANNLKRHAVAGVDVAAAGAKVSGIFLIILWCVIILAGRWIAYAPS